MRYVNELISAKTKYFPYLKRILIVYILFKNSIGKGDLKASKLIENYLEESVNAKVIRSTLKHYSEK